MKILSVTDFSANSRAGMRFAIQWSIQQQIELVFLHVIHLMKPVSWSGANYDTYRSDEINKTLAELESFVAAMFKKMGRAGTNYTCSVIEGVSPDLEILKFCRDRGDIDAICISTRGAGKFERLFGTNTGNLITKSEVPVIAVPKKYRVKPITNLVYACDLVEVDNEIERIAAFAAPMNCKVTLMHFYLDKHLAPDESFILQKIRAKHELQVDVQFFRRTPSLSLLEDIRQKLRVVKPSMLVMFTRQNRTLFERLFMSSKSEELSFESNLPLLVFRKEETTNGQEVNAKKSATG